MSLNREDEGYVEAESVFSKTIGKAWKSFANITKFLELFEVSAGTAYKEILRRRRRDMVSFLTDPEYDEMWTRKIDLHSEEFSSLLIKSVTADIVSAETSVHSAAIVFSHSILDEAIYEFLRGLTMLSPESWEEHLKGKVRFSLGSVKCNSYDQLLKQEVDRELADLKKSSLMRKAGVYTSLCPPKMDSVMSDEFKYDPERIKRWDDLRVSIVHGDGLRQPATDLDLELFYLQRVCMYWFGLANKQFDVRLSPSDLFESQTN